MTRNRYCTGCGVVFSKTHLLYRHRRIDRCGGRFLPIAERSMIDKLRLERELQAREERNVRLRDNSRASKLDKGQRQQRSLGRDLRRREAALARRQNRPH